MFGKKAKNSTKKIMRDRKRKEVLVNGLKFPSVREARAHFGVSGSKWKRNFVDKGLVLFSD